MDWITKLDGRLSFEEKWLYLDIPYRIRGAIGPNISAFFPDQHKEASGLVLPANILGLCIHHASHQGQMVAVRWLIEFIGIQGMYNNGSLMPTESRAASTKPRNDFGIQRLPRGKYLKKSDSKAAFLSEIWDACSKAVMHPTEGTNHSSVEPERLLKATHLIIDHLNATIYSPPEPLLFEILYNEWWRSKVTEFRC